ncbi:MAG: beta-ketoacyl synthase, partial [Streptomyces sp.]|nr:beta-ketoacyl synthase [Streptomyces sp.]
AMAPLLPLRAEGDRTPLFCVHPAAGVSWRYTGLLPHLGADQPVLGIQAAGLDGRQPLSADAKEMTESYLAVLRERQPHGPYRLLGWSFGGAVAHAMACALQRQGEHVELLAMLDAPPTHTREWTPEQVERQVSALLLRVAGLAQPPAGETPGVAAVLDRLERERGDGPVPVTRDEAERIAAVMRNILLISPGLVPEIFDGDVLFFSASADGPAPDGPADAALAHGKEQAWRPYVTGEMRVHPVACGHYDMTEPGPMAEIGGVLAAALDALTPRT